MLSVHCPEAKTSSDVCREEGCQQVMQRLRREVFPEQLKTAEVYPNKGSRSLRLIMKGADAGPGAALNCWLLLPFEQWMWVGAKVEVHRSDS